MADYLDHEKIRQKLEDKRTDLLIRIGRDAGGKDSPDVYNPDKSDLAQDYVKLDRDTALIEHMEKLLEQVDAALQRLAEKTFGECTSCGQEIAVERLEAIPWAELCIQCQKKLEGN